MDSRTGEIMDLEEARRRILEKPQDAKYIREIPEKFHSIIPEIQNMNRKDRRAWLRKNGYPLNLKD